MSNLSTPVQIQVPGPHLGGALGWSGAALRPSSVSLVGDRHGLVLPAAPEGPLGFGCRDGSLGRLTLPRGIALDGPLRTSSTGKASTSSCTTRPRPDTSRRPPSWPCRIWAEVRTSPTTRRIPDASYMRSRSRPMRTSSMWSIGVPDGSSSWPRTVGLCGISGVWTR